MSNVKFSCPHCGQPLCTDTSKAGLAARCLKCSGSIVVPQPQKEVVFQPQKVLQSLGDCPYCRTEMSDSDRIRNCPSCATPHHQDCWNENKGCTVFGCSMAPPDEEKVSVQVPTGGRIALQPAAAMAGTSTAATLPYPHSQKTNAEGATSSLVYGILGFFICGPIFGIAAISNANKAKKTIAANPEMYEGDGLATAGLVLGIIDLSVWALIILGNLATT